jgi:hypothetical protein
VIRHTSWNPCPLGGTLPFWETTMDAIEVFVLHHERLPMQVERDFLQGLSDAQMRSRRDGLNSIAWHVWHIARCEDALNLLLAGRSPGT